MSTNPPPAEGEIRQILVHPAAWAALERWLNARNIDLCPVPVEDDLPTYCMQPRLFPDPSDVEARTCGDAQ
jgi:hypothetical protein